MSKDGNDSRIDLSRFDGITKGKWEIINTPSGGIDIGVKSGKNAHSPVITFTQSMGEMCHIIERDVADMTAIAAVPQLIAELKRVYAENDELKKGFPWKVIHIEGLLDALNAQDICCSCGYLQCMCDDS
jgi:hypothetical protein